LKFLIVDDNEAMRDTLRRMIAHKGDVVFDCADGSDALSKYRRHRPEWVLMDIKMKNMGGIEATKDILAFDPKAKVVIVTDYGDKFFRRAALSAGASGFVQKENLAELDKILRPG
jgi:DNA-binding NarL/FixJ family response regulator